MTSIEIILIAVSLASDAFAVSLSKGLTTNKVTIKHILTVGIFFGFFQFMMPIIGYLLSKNIGIYLIRYSHLIGFIILSILGISFFTEEDKESDTGITFIGMFIPAIATSVDALAIGIPFSLMLDNIIAPCLVIGIITFILSSLGVIIGSKIQDKIKFPAKKIGGIILILLGIKMLLEYLF